MVHHSQLNLNRFHSTRYNKDYLGLVNPLDFKNFQFKIPKTPTPENATLGNEHFRSVRTVCPM